MRYNEEETELILEAVNCKMDWLRLLIFSLEHLEYFTVEDRAYVKDWLKNSKHLYC